MTADDLITLAKRKNAARSALSLKRARAWGVGTTDAARKIQMDADTIKEQEAYDNLCDEYAIRLIEFQER